MSDLEKLIEGLPIKAISRDEVEVERHLITRNEAIKASESCYTAHTRLGYRVLLALMDKQQPAPEWKPGMWAETDTGWKFLIKYIECGSLVGQDEQGRWGGADIGVCRTIMSPMHEWKVGEWAEFTEHQSDGDRKITFQVSGIIYADPTWLRSATNPRQNYRACDCRLVPPPDEPKPKPSQESDSELAELNDVRPQHLPPKPKPFSDPSWAPDTTTMTQHEWMCWQRELTLREHIEAIKRQLAERKAE